MPHDRTAALFAADDRRYADAIALALARSDLPAEVRSVLQEASARLQTLSHGVEQSHSSPFKTLIEGMRIGVVIQDAQATIVLCNQAAARMLGLSEDQLLGKTSFDPRWQLIYEDGSQMPTAEMPALRCIATQQPIQQVTAGVYRPETDDYVWLLIDAEPHFNDDGSFRFVLCSFTDITQQKLVEQELAKERNRLKSTNDRYQRAVLIGSVGVWEFNLCTRRLTIEPHLLQMLGYAPNDLPNDVNRWLELVPAEERPILQNAISEDYLRQHGTFEVEHRLRHKDGSYRWMVTRGGMEMNAEGKPARIACATIDITDRKQIETDLIATEERYRRISEMISDYAFAYRIEPDGSITHEWITESFTRMTGYTQREIDAQGTWSLYPPEEQARVIADVQRIIAGEETHAEYRIITKSGETRWLWIDRLPVWSETEGRVIRYFGAARDITESKLAQERLRENEARYRALFAASERQKRELELLDRVRTALSRHNDLPDLVRSVVEAVREVFGYTQVSLYLLRGDTLYLQHQVGYDSVITAVPISKGVSGRTVRNARPTFLRDVRDDPDFLGAIEDITSEICIPLFDAGRVVGTFNVESTGGVELTEDDLRLMLALAEHINIAIARARLFGEARAEQERNAALLNAIPDMLLRLDHNGTILELKPSPAFELPDTPEAMRGRGVTELINDTIGEQTITAARAAIATGLPQIFEYQLLREGILTDFETRIVQSGNFEALALIRDISERKRAEQSLRERERVELLRDFLGDISHDFRSPISTLMTSSHLLRKLTEKLLRDGMKLSSALLGVSATGAEGLVAALNDTVVKVNERSETIDETAARLNRLVESLTEMARLEGDMTYTLRLEDLNACVRHVVDAMRPLAQDKEQVVSHQAQRKIMPVYIDEREFSRVIQNLMSNAIEYTPRGGTITVSVYTHDAHTVLSVRDSGIGIDEADLPHIFERFYRTHQARAAHLGGTGLGLAITKKIVEAHNGYIEVESALGKGTEFRVILP